MVDFRKQLVKAKAVKPTDPIELYDTLDRSSDKGPLRPAQLAVLKEWTSKHQAAKDVIVKLHTGQGKTLIGLLMLQARLNTGKGPSLYLCPDNYLIDQTCEQAKQFGIATCTANPDLPEAFLGGDKILVTSVQKLFNGLTKFGLGAKSVKIGALLMDDAHACADTIREQCRIRIPKDEAAYDTLKTLFSAELEQQGAGTFADIQNGKRDAFLPIPYWAWTEREGEIAAILSKNRDKDSVKYAWPLLKDMLGQCQGIVSGAAIEIEPYIAPLSVFGSYWNAGHRIFMSATVTDDAFLVKGLQLGVETIVKPLSYAKETWSGEKMVLIPSLINDTLTRESVVEKFGKPNPKRKSGVVALAPSFSRTKDWQTYGALVAEKGTVAGAIDDLKQEQFEKTVVLVNRYDGIDLPDNACRILIFDSKPYSESLSDLVQESCRPNSEATLIRTVRTVEQGMGRSVRGEKDYCAVVVIGTDLVRLVRDRTSRKYLSSQMSTQLELGIEIAGMAKQEIEEGKDPMQAFLDLMKQALKRDEGWKAFYVEKMEAVKPKGANESILKTYAAELAAENAFNNGDYSGATQKLQAVLDAKGHIEEDKGWYLQEMARYNHRANRIESQRLQAAAHKGNRYLLKPQSGVTVAKLEIVSHGRVERILNWVKQFPDYPSLDVRVSDVLGNLVFGAKAEKFEHALNDLSALLGFAGERPDKEWKEGPDNLWALDSTQYILWECKNEVELGRIEISKYESAQMNSSSAWFGKHYPGMQVKHLMVHPTHKVSSAAAFTQEVQVVREKELRKLLQAVRDFFKSFEGTNFKDLSPQRIQQQIKAYKIDVLDILTLYSKPVRDTKS